MGIKSGANTDGLRVHNRVRVLRADWDLSRDGLAQSLGIAYRTLGYIEREQYQPSLRLAWRVCEFFGLPMEAVWSREPFDPMSRMLYEGRERRGGDSGE